MEPASPPFHHLLLTILALVPLAEAWIVGDVTSGFKEFGDSMSGITDKMGYMKTDVTQLSRQVMLNQYNNEERIRTEGGSGIKQVRLELDGPYSFYHATHNGRMVQGIHDHSNFIDTLGMAEIVAVLNGVEFRTRHNDYKIVMPSTTSNEYGATEPIEHPAVPPAVSALTDLDAQVAEMQEWFRAFRDQDYSVRDYRPYFKPVLCYMEGAWTMEDEHGAITEPFDSDRHSLEEDTWFDLIEKNRFFSIAGAKDKMENLAHLPTTIVSVNETTGVVTYAQWNYRILCHPLSMDVPFKWLKPVEDYSNRLHQDRGWERHLNSRSARFTVFDPDYDQPIRWTRLDTMFQEIRGKDNIPDSDLVYIEGGETMYSAEFEDTNTLVQIHPAYYTRQYKFEKNGAQGIQETYRGYSDPHLWVAKTKQTKVAPFSIYTCESWKKLNCYYPPHRFSYAIPLEIVYLTPLTNWNPLNIIHYENEEDAKGGDRKGWADRPYRGTWKNIFYRTPEEFFGGGGDLNQQDTADTSHWYSLYFETADGTVEKTRASGTRVFTDKIGNDVGQIRLRWPIAPVHAEESTAFKEISAIRQTLADSGLLESRTMMLRFNMSQGDLDNTHEFLLSPNDLLYLKEKDGRYVEVTTTYCNNHAHTLRLTYVDNELSYAKCDGEHICFDNHDTVVYSMDTVESLGLVAGQPSVKA